MAKSNEHFTLTDGTQMWFHDGKLHRLDGPAVEWSNGVKGWFLNGRQLDSIEHFIEVQRMLYD